MPEITAVRGIPVTSVRRTLLDVAGLRHPRLESMLDQALVGEMTTLGQLWLLYEESWTRGRRGIAILRALLAERTPGRAPIESELEALFVRVVSTYSLPEPRRQFWIELPSGPVRVDFCYPASRLVIEVDGYAFHSDRESFDSDRERDNELQAMGWRVLRFTWAQLRWRRDWVARLITRHLTAEWHISRR